MGEIKLIAEEILRRKAMREVLTRFDAAQQAAITTLQRSVKYFEGLVDRGNERDRTGNSSNGGEWDSPTRLERYYERKKNEVWGCCSAVRKGNVGTSIM